MSSESSGVGHSYSPPTYQKPQDDVKQQNVCIFYACSMRHTLCRNALPHTESWKKRIAIFYKTIRNFAHILECVLDFFWVFLDFLLFCEFFY